MDDSNLAFLGKGWSFPPEFTANGKEMITTSGVDNIHKSVEIILHTEVGERVMQENFGGSLRRFVFEPLSSKLLADIKERITMAILRHESRVMLDHVNIVEDRTNNDLLIIQLQYTVRSTNTRFNMVYPFYLKEASA